MGRKMGNTVSEFWAVLPFPDLLHRLDCEKAASDWYPGGRMGRALAEPRSAG